MLKTVSSVTNAIGALNYKGTWNANTNTPTLASGAGVKGDYYQVSAAGSTILDGISNWGIGDVVAFNGSAWQRIEGGADLNGVNLTTTGDVSHDIVAAGVDMEIRPISHGVSQTPKGPKLVSGGGFETSWKLGSDGSGFPYTELEQPNAVGYFQVKVGGNLAFRLNIGGSASFPINYGAVVGATNRDLYVDDTGLIGYISSTRESKTNITEINDVSWLSALKPVEFNRRKLMQDGDKIDADGRHVMAYGDDFYDEKEYGLIADDVEVVNSELCFYDIVDGAKVLKGIHYSKLIVPMLKRVQQLEAELATLKGA